MGCFYCDEHHEGREAIMYKVGEMEAGVLYLFKDQAHKGRCALALKNHRKELCECGPEELAAFARDLARASGAVKELWGCDKINLGSDDVDEWTNSLVEGADVSQSDFGMKFVG